MASSFADDLIEELLDRTSKGEQLTKLCADPRMPKRSTVYSWIDEGGEFAGRFRAARARGVHALAEECLDIADEEAKDPVQVANKRVRIDTRLRLAGKWLASEYGDKLAVQTEATVTHRYDLDNLDEAALTDLERILADAQRSTGSAGETLTSSVH